VSVSRFSFSRKARGGRKEEKEVSRKGSEALRRDVNFQFKNYFYSFQFSVSSFQYFDQWFEFPDRENIAFWKGIM